jgi:formylglycine-generating enzyme required for sulfatase activity
MVEAGANEKLKVFISYSRRDSGEFADELLAGLEVAGFAPFLDRHDIAPGEDWEARLDGLIQQADTVVYVISPESVRSERCEWEVDRALANSKRLLPVIFKAVSEAEIPRDLERRQFVRFDGGFGFARALALLTEALRQDIDWIREHTRLGELAARWEARGRPVSLLLRGDEVATAMAWAARRKSGAPEVTERMRSFIAASKSGEAAYLAKTKTGRRHLFLAESFAALLALVVIATLIAWWQQDWLKERLYTLVNVIALKTAQEHALKVGDSFKECTDCPEMIVVPGGFFTMGSRGDEKDRRNDEGPRHQVAILRPLAVSKFEVTFNEWDTCVRSTGCASYRPPDNGWGRDRQPTINVAWYDAQRYVAWLSRITGKTYRLLSEAEYEYAERAGTQTAYPWGDSIKLNGAAMANCNGCGSPWDKKQTAPVGSFPPNAFGLHDMAGNVWEWTEDCYHNSYDQAPTNGSAWTAGDCSSGRVVRGGSWFASPGELRSAARSGPIGAGGRGPIFGFRVARTLSP